MKLFSLALTITLLNCAAAHAADWTIDSAEEWKANLKRVDGKLSVEEGYVSPQEKTATLTTKLHSSDQKRSAATLTVTQSPLWQNWNPIENLGPSNLADAPVLLTVGPDNYWMFGRYGSAKARQKSSFKPEPARLDGFDMPLVTTPFPNQFDAPGGLKPGKGGYHAWQSRDMKNWVHHGPVTEGFSRWVTSAEYIDGKALIYYDFPNDQDPHVYVDEDLFDGEPPGAPPGVQAHPPFGGKNSSPLMKFE